MTVHVLGVRHHGPGSARAVGAALDRIRPDAVLVEGPADADPLLGWITHPDLVPPVALLAHAADAPGRAVFWPFARFSPEWQALAWAARHGVRARFCDLPAAAVLDGRGPSAPDPGPPPDPDPQPDPYPQPDPDSQPDPYPQPDPDSQPDPDPQPDPDAGAAPPDSGGPLPGAMPLDPLRTDPIAVLAAAAGHDDPERWWEDLVEQRAGEDSFAALTEAMAAVREAAPPVPGAAQEREDRREAHMRQVLRATVRDGAGTVAVVCGAWHAPALAGPLPPAARDAALLRGLPRRKAVLSWTPWTHSRLATASGYGAGITSPGWYEHLFATPDRPVISWLTRVAGVLRDRDLPVSSAHVIEAVRLTEALAALRGRPSAGLTEVTDATRAVLVDGDEVALALVTDRLVVGEALGTVPADAPTVPLAADLEARARRLRVRREADERVLDLDLRRDVDLERSRLFHRLTVLGVPWAVRRESDVRGTGTFRETWALRWQPELSVALVEAAVWGTTVDAAAAARLVDAATGGGTLAAATDAVESCLMADLPGALGTVLAALDARAAADVDVAHLMDALPALVRTVRYGDVRGTDTGAARRVADALAARIRAGLPAAVTGLDGDAAAALVRSIDGVHEALAMQDDPATRAGWTAVLDGLADRRDVHGLIAGRCTRLVRDAPGPRRTDAHLPDARPPDARPPDARPPDARPPDARPPDARPPDDRVPDDRVPDDPGAVAARRFAAALSAGSPAPVRAAFVEGFLAGGGLVLVHDTALLALLDGWLTGLAADDFVATLPVLRRTFAAFDGGERRGIGDRVRHGLGPDPGRAAPDGGAADLDLVRAAPAVALAARLLGLTVGAGR